MWPVLLDLGVVRVTVFGLSLVVAFALGSFMFWRRLRGDYDGEQLLTMWLWLVVASWMGSGIWACLPAGRCGGSWQLPGAVILPFAVMAWWSRWHKWDGWELVDAWGAVSLAVAVLAAAGWGPVSWPVALTSAIGLVVASLVRRWYRRWRWYTSGRMGVTGTIAIAWWGVINLVIANFAAWAVYSLGCTVVLAVVVIYLRSGRQINRDIAFIWPPKK